MSTNQTTYIETIGKLAIADYAVSRLLPSTVIAQAIHESAWGTSTLAVKANNHFGIKASAPWTGPVYNKNTGEEVGGKTIFIDADFRSYPSLEASVKDHGAFLTTGWRKDHYKVYGVTDPQEVLNNLKAGGYATDSSYVTKCMRYITEYNLTTWDKKVLTTPTGGTNTMEYIYESLMNVGAMNGIWGVVIHNDAGSMTPKQYVEWLRNRNKELGIAHYYINRTQNARVIDTNLIAYHTANANGNGHYIGYEVCQSASASDADFLANEEAVFKQAAEDLLFYELPANRDTVRLHMEFSSTSCPLRSWNLHGKNINAVKDYFIARIQHYMNGGTTVAQTIVAPVASNRISAGYNVLLVQPGYSIDSKPWGEQGAEYWGTTDPHVGKAFFIYEENASKEYANGQGLGWVDKRALLVIDETRKLVSPYDAVVHQVGYSIDTLPWGEAGFAYRSATDAILGKTVTVVLETANGNYAYIKVDGYLAGWVDKKAFIAPVAVEPAPVVVPEPVEVVPEPVVVEEPKETEPEMAIGWVVKRGTFAPEKEIEIRNAPSETVGAVIETCKVGRTIDFDSCFYDGKDEWLHAVNVSSFSNEACYVIGRKNGEPQGTFSI